MADVRRFEIWDALECDSGSRLVVIRDALNVNETLRLDGKKYRDVTTESGEVFRSEAVPGFWIDPAWLFTTGSVKPTCLL